MAFPEEMHDWYVQENVELSYVGYTHIVSVLLCLNPNSTFTLPSSPSNLKRYKAIKLAQRSPLSIWWPTFSLQIHCESIVWNVTLMAHFYFPLRAFSFFFKTEINAGSVFIEHLKNAYIHYISVWKTQPCQRYSSSILNPFQLSLLNKQ